MLFSNSLDECAILLGKALKLNTKGKKFENSGIITWPEQGFDNISVTGINNFLEKGQ